MNQQKTIKLKLHLLSQILSNMNADIMLFLFTGDTNKSTLMSKNWKVRKEISQVWDGEMASLLMTARHKDSEVLSL